MTPDYSLDLAKEFTARCVQNVTAKTSLALGIFRNDNLIGSSGFNRFDWKVRTTEIGYWLAKDEEGKGIVSSVCRVLIDYAFSELEMNRIEIRCSAQNLRSGAIPVRLGFTKEGTLRQAEIHGEELHDTDIYSLLADDPRVW